MQRSHVPLAHLPQSLRRLLDHYIHWAEADRSCALVLHGSAIKGGVDDYSDLDVTVVHADAADITEIRSGLAKLATSSGSVLASFPADHVGFYSAQITYAQCEDKIIKTDVHILPVSRASTLPAESMVLVDASGLMTDVELDRVPPVPTELLLNKLNGWLWFTFARLHRGEFFAAARSLDFSREHALLPLMLDRMGLPQEGHRRLEQRLPPPIMRALEQTHPSSLTSDAIFAALKALHGLIATELSLAKVASKEQLTAALNQIWNCIAANKARRRATMNDDAMEP